MFLFYIIKSKIDQSKVTPFQYLAETTPTKASGGPPAAPLPAGWGTREDGFVAVCCVKTGVVGGCFLMVR